MFGITFVCIYFDADDANNANRATRNRNNNKTNKTLLLWERLLVLIWVQPIRVYL